MKNIKIPVVIEQDEDGYYIIDAQLFKGCHTYGKTIEEAISNMQEAINLCLDNTNDNSIEFSITFKDNKVC